jgi:hypothetical protein
MPVVNRSPLVWARLGRFQRLSFVCEVRPEPLEKISIEFLPRIQRAESDAFLIFQDMGDAFGGGADEAESESATDTKRQPGKGGNLPPCQRLVGELTILALDGPEFAVVSCGNDINALVSRGQFELLDDGGGNFIVEPDVF